MATFFEEHSADFSALPFLVEEIRGQPGAGCDRGADQRRRGLMTLCHRLAPVLGVPALWLALGFGLHRNDALTSSIVRIFSKGMNFPRPALANLCGSGYSRAADCGRKWGGSLPNRAPALGTVDGWLLPTAMICSAHLSMTEAR